MNQSLIPSEGGELLVLLQGGLGNQLLQLVLAESLARVLRRRAVGSCVLMESRTRKLRGLTYRTLSSLVSNRLVLKPVPWHRHLAHRLEARLGNPFGATVLTDQLLQKAAGGSLPLDQLNWVRTIHSHATHAMLFGAQFTPSWQLTLETLRTCWARTPVKVAMHVRRRDYMNPRSGFVLLDEPYYKAALNKMLEVSPFNTKPPIVHTFSDDPSWCLNHLQDPRWQLEISRGTPEQDLASMAHAQILITGNSSFSAIAGHLAQLVNPSSLVLTPGRWLLKPEIRLGDLRKANWEVVNQ